MKQNITLATIKAINRDKGFHYFDNLKSKGHKASDRGYMSKDGKFAWFWTYNPQHKRFTIRIFGATTGVIYSGVEPHLSRHERDATERCKICCMAYDRDRTFVNPQEIRLPDMIPVDNYEKVMA